MPRKKRTYADRAEYLKNAVAQRRKTIRENAVSILGGKFLSVVIQNVSMHSIFIIRIQEKKRSVYLRMGLHVHWSV